MQPQSLAATLTEQMKQFEPGTREHHIRQHILSADTNVRVLRDLVMSHPDLAARLCKPPLSYAKASQWDGFVPPDHFNGEHNDSSRREALAALVAEAMERLQEAGDP